MNRLFIGNRRYSSWSMRGWLAVKLAGLDVEEIVIPLAGGNTPEVKRVSPSGFVPLLEHDGNLVWDSLAIVEYCAELAPLWPADRTARAAARAIAAEMHSGFRDLRSDMPMNVCGSFPGHGRTPGAAADIARIERLWSEVRIESGGPFLFGAFGAADIMFAPVAARFATYRPELTLESEEYCALLLSHPLVAQWIAAAAAEPAEWRIARYEQLA